MLTGELRNQIDQIWNTFWTGGISNPLEVIEQITYLLFLKRLDDLQTVEELKAQRLKKPSNVRFSQRAKTQRSAPTKIVDGLISRISNLGKCTPWSASMFSPSFGRSEEMNQPMPTT